MAAEKLTANGVDLSSLVWNVTDLAGLLTVPARRGEDIAVPGRHGKLTSPFKLYDAAEYVLPMWVVGADPVTGLAPANPYLAGAQAFLANLDALMAIFGQDTVTLEHTRPDGSVRRAVCQVTARIEPSRRLGAPIAGKLSVALANNGAFWVETTNTTSSWSEADNTQVALAEFGSITAPTDELEITFTGPVTNPELSQLSTGIYIAYDDALAAGRKLVLDTKRWRLTPGDGTPWTPDYSKLRHGGAPTGRWFQLYPQPSSPPIVLWTHDTAGGAEAAASVAGPRKYLTA